MREARKRKEKKMMKEEKVIDKLNKYGMNHTQRGGIKEVGEGEMRECDQRTLKEKVKRTERRRMERKDKYCEEKPK